MLGFPLLTSLKTHLLNIFLLSTFLLLTTLFVVTPALLAGHFLVRPSVTDPVLFPPAQPLERPINNDLYCDHAWHCVEGHSRAAYNVIKELCRP